jgi:hypothetical protein
MWDGLAADRVHLLLLLPVLLLQFNDICWRGAPHDFKGLDKVFPTGTISFTGGQRCSQEQQTPGKHWTYVTRM